MPMKCIDQMPPPRANAPTQRHKSRPRGLPLRLTRLASASAVNAAALATR